MESVLISVEASGLGLGGTDYLGACHVRADNREADVMELVAEHGMIENAISELQKNILEQISE